MDDKKKSRLNKRVRGNNLTDNDIIRKSGTKLYSHDQMCAMARMVFSDEYINKNNLVEKAIKNFRYSCVWFYSAMHFVSMFRSCDIDSLALVELPYSPDTVLEMITEKKYDKDAVVLANEVEKENALTRLSAGRRASKLIIIHPVLKKAFGIIYSIYFAFVYKGMRTDIRLIAKDYISFFGDKYQETFGMHVFSGLRAANTINYSGNKSVIESALQMSVPSLSSDYISGSIRKGYNDFEAHKSELKVLWGEPE